MSVFLSTNRLQLLLALVCALTATTLGLGVAALVLGRLALSRRQHLRPGRRDRGAWPWTSKGLTG
jgi:hypothetical protein